MMKSLTMRLTHLGLNAYFVGDMNVPPATKEDLLLVSAGPGFFSTVDALVGVATKADCKTIVFTARPDRLNEHTYHQVVHIPAQTMADDLKKPLNDGDKFSVWLTFKHAGEVEVEVWVQTPKDANKAEEHKH